MVDRDLRTEPNGLRTRLERNRRKPARRAEGETGNPRTGQAKACGSGAEGEAGNLNSVRRGLGEAEGGTDGAGSNGTTRRGSGT